jgi:hypothetical protein
MTVHQRARDRNPREVGRKPLRIGKIPILANLRASANGHNLLKTNVIR